MIAGNGRKLYPVFWKQRSIKITGSLVRIFPNFIEEKQSCSVKRTMQYRCNIDESLMNSIQTLKNQLFDQEI